MKHPKINTKVVHSQSKHAWNVVSTTLCTKYKIARVPYYFDEKNEDLSTENKHEALRLAKFISFCFNNPDKVLTNEV